MSLLSRFDALTKAGFVESPGFSRQWRHTVYSYLTVECHFGIWTMRNPSDSVEISVDDDVQPALELLSGHAHIVRKVDLP